MRGGRGKEGEGCQERGKKEGEKGDNEREKGRDGERKREERDGEVYLSRQ